MAKTVAIVTSSPEVAEFYCKQLTDLFGEAIKVKAYSFEDNTVNQIDFADMYVISTYSIYETMKKNIPDNSEVVITNITLLKSSLKKIMSIPAGTKAMLVNLSMGMCIETIALIYQMGADHIELTPVYPEMKGIPKLDLAITPGESRHVPKNACTRVVDIGHRLLDTSTIIEIALKLDAEHLLEEEKFKNYFDSIVTNSYSLEKLTGRTNTLESQFDILLKTLNDGIIGVNSEGTIFAFNESAEKIIGAEKNDILGKEAKEVLPCISFDEVRNSFKPMKSKLIKINDTHINLSVYPIITMKKFIGAFAILQKFKEAEQQQHKLRLQLLNKGYKAKYTFNDIVGESSAMVKTKMLANKMAKNDYSILITGESGTGKELFAQAIHNSSNRNDYPFVAVNCAAIPENLLESELFGYEDGSFTGAKKGGKMGLFEFAHMGTLFLDEIGEMSLNLQAKMLRILQEKEFVHIGGNSVIKVDVRIIAATNRNLKELVDNGDFRKDLYYRLNVLPLTIPPLKHRGKDILLIIERVKKNLHSNFYLSEEAEEAFLNYSWDGNIRELINYLEYLDCIAEDEITLADLPFVASNDESHGADECDDNGKIFEEFRNVAKNRMDEYLFVINELVSCRKNKATAGRKAIAKASEGKNMFLTEQEVRNMLLNLEKLNLIKILKGRGGSRVTDLGMKVFNKAKMGQVDLQ